MLKLDIKDYKLLYELDTNSRQSFHRIAHKVGLSKDAVIYRINRLKEEGIITHYQTIIDVGTLGYTSFRVYLKLQNTTPEIEHNILEFLKSQSAITWIASMDGEYELALWILVKNIKEMNQLWKQLIAKHGNYIAKKWIAIFTKVTYFPRTFLLGKNKNFDQYVFITEPQTPDVDDTDITILKTLAPNARVSILEIAKAANITPKTAIARIRTLEKKKIIIGYRTLFSIEKLGAQYFKVFITSQNMTPQKEKELRGFIKQHPHTIYDNEVLGGADFEIEVQVYSMDDFRNFLSQLKEKFYDIIKEQSYMVFFKEHKYVFFPG